MYPDLLILHVHYPKLLYFTLLLLGLPLWLQAQIVDDSTRLVYGPQTTTYVRESSIYYQSGHQYHPDTAVRNFYRFLPVEQSGYRLQDLGNIGTALQPIFYTLPREIGARSGFTVYDYWFNDPEEIRYYNTRSPYTRLFYSQGGNGRSWVDVTHARNITPRWSAGVDFRRITADKQIGPTRTRDDKQTVSTAYNVYTWYRDSVDRYQLMAHLSRMRHRVQEPGGILVGAQPPASITEIIQYANSPVRRANARSEELRVNQHLYHQYKLVSALQLYHILDRTTSDNIYADQAPDSAYYRVRIPTGSGPLTEDFNTRIFQNQAGIKGGYRAGQWNAYIKHRAVRFRPNPEEEFEVNEVGAGGYLALQPDTVRTLRLEAELRTDGQYRFEALAQNNWLQLHYQRSQYKPAFIYQYRNTLVDQWNRDFRDPTADRLEGTLMLKLGPLSLQPGLQLSIVQNPLYLRAESLSGNSRPLGIRPEQGAAAQMIAPRLRFSLQLGEYLHWDGDAQYTRVSGNSAIAFQVPDWLVNTSVYFEGPMFGGNMIGQLGVDIHMKAAYYADAYDPALRQFVVQQDFLVPSYPIANLFFGFKINRTRIFARMSHLNQGMTAEGYFTTPYYSGLQRTFDLGIDWLFFD
jgi:hypothetical protein